MKKIISSIIIVMIILLSFANHTFAAGQLQATIEITPSATEVVAGDKVVFTFVTKNIVNSIDGTITAIGGKIEYDKNFFQLVNGGLGAMVVGEDTGLFNAMTVVEDGGTNGIITLKVVENPTGSGVVKFTKLEVGDGREGEGAYTLGTAKTADQEFTISLKNQGGQEPCEHTYENYTDNGDGTHSEICIKCGERRTEEHTYENGNCTKCEAKEPVTECEHKYGNAVDNEDGTHSVICTECGEKSTAQHVYEDGICIECNAIETTDEDSEGENSQEDDEKDETIVDEEIPQAGLSKLLILGIFTIAIIAVAMHRNNLKYKDIK